MSPRTAPFRVGIRHLRGHQQRSDNGSVNAGFDAFISYSGADDRVIASQLQNRIEKVAKKWYRPPVVRVFFDKTSIAAGTKLWDRIEYGLSRASWLILIASPQSAHSAWVGREVEWWIANRSLDTIFIVHTDGGLNWDATSGRFSLDSTAIAPFLRDKFDREPVWATVPRTDPGSALEYAALSITSQVRGIDFHELSSQAFREHRRTMRWARGAIVSLSVLLIAAVVLSVTALVEKHHANQARNDALDN
jgi:hypothetical protein